MPLDANGKPQKLRYSSPTNIVWQRDPSLERKLISDYIARSHKFRLGYDSSLPFRTSAITALNSGLISPGSFNSLLRRASDLFTTSISTGYGGLCSYTVACPSSHMARRRSFKTTNKIGKRWRAALLAASYEVCGGEGGPETVATAGASLELLQAYLLVHDDWMDGDDERRGGPSVPAMMRERLGAFADAASVLAGDLASGWAQMLLCELPLAP